MLEDLSEACFIWTVSVVEWFLAHHIAVWITWTVHLVALANIEKQNC